uniref:Galactose oxidase n=1 Tax=Anthurium amnicola TaxID=1678845 RepID=A0A1D1ZCQ4_9ARAE
MVCRTSRWLAAAVIILLFQEEALISKCRSSTTGRRGGGGQWELLLNSSGVVAMHMALTHRNTVVMFDQTGAGPSGYRLPRQNSCNSSVPSYWAHSVEYDLSSGTIRPLLLCTDTWCSSGSFLSNGTLLQTGGYGGGARKVRYFHPCQDKTCDWVEPWSSPLADERWYASDQVLPETDDKVIVVGGLGSNTYEFFPTSSLGGSFELPFLNQTRNKKEGDSNLYPFLHLSSDGNLFVFANRDSILLDYKQHRVVRTFPRMPGGGSRSYPSTASSVMLPLDHADGFRAVEVMVCGGGASGAYRAARRRRFREALSSCGRMVVTAAEPRWEMEDMPGQRLMSDMLLLPTGDVLLVNGATRGCAGWGRARGAARRPYLYQPGGAPGQRFSVLRPSGIARMYHSSAVVLPDGRVLVAGSNPNRRYVVSGDGVRYPTELRVEAFSPPYMQAGAFSDRRASNLSLIGVSGDSEVKYGEDFGVRLQFGRRWEGEALGFHVYAPPFATHSTSMNQRLLKLRCKSIVREEDDGSVSAVVVAPPSPNVAPSGYYLLTVVNGGIPSQGIWVRFVHE